MGSSGSAGGGVTTLISRKVLTVAAANITFSAIPATYENLVLQLVGASSVAAYSDVVNLTINGDLNADYLWQEITGIGSAVASGGGGSATSIRCGFVPGSTAGAGVFGAILMTFPSYARATMQKLVLSSSGAIEAAGGVQVVSSHVGQWLSTGAINSINLAASQGNFPIDTVASLYGES